MFKKLKQKLAEETDGEQSSLKQNARQTPKGPGNESSNETPENSEENRGLPPSNSAANVTSSPSFSTPKTSQIKPKSTPREVLDRVYSLLDSKAVQSDSRNGEKPHSGETTPPKSTSTPSKTLSQDSISDTETPKRAVERQGSIPPSSPMSAGGRSDAESDAEQSATPNTPVARLEGATKEEVVAMFRKQERVLARYKTRFSEVVEAYKNLQKENEKLQNNLTQSQDKALRRISEMKETVELEKQAKMHLEETLQLSLDEKEDIIKALQTQVQLLKQQGPPAVPGTDVLDAGLGSQSDEQKLQQQSLQERVRSSFRCRYRHKHVYSYM
ncbi:golgin subfamily A member 4-like [Stylophora pistillata]|uniref:golgin subfamily A member 4-like n=1 Tax=Stylophora pistillata TaxID=50429 RepID=UPI000C0390F5|nr:golgin subfamily A member 4-like [Stylophora pistillata]